MQSIEAIKRRIDNVQDLLSIVKTMKTLAAINIRQYEQAVESLEDYNRTVELGFQVLLSQQPNGTPPERPNPHSVLGAVILGSDQGMCGQFNEQIAAFAIEELGRLGIPRPRRLILALGARLTAYLEAEGHPIDEARSIPGSVTGITPLVQDIVMKIDAWRTLRNTDRILLFYNRPLSGAAYRPYVLHLLPVNWERLRHLALKEWHSRTLPMFTMEWQPLFSALLRQYLFVSIYRALAESLMSENASRLATMQSAEHNIQEHLEDLNALFHQQRQHSITEELLDIVAGFEALTTE
jgi:F-type H+-transporting ATPase subunit gamma